jgi:hypothetical protein
MYSTARREALTRRIKVHCSRMMESRDGRLCEAVPEAGMWELSQPIGDLQ